MASRFADSMRYSNGTPYQAWFERNFTSKDARTHGRDIPGIGPFNSTLLVIHDRSELNDQTSSLYNQGIYSRGSVSLRSRNTKRS
jgi:hypothetical protein